MFLNSVGKFFLKQLLQRTIQTHTLQRTICKQSHVTPQRCFKWDKGNVKTRAGYGLFYSYISECTDADGQIMQPRFRRSLFSPPLFMYSAYSFRKQYCSVVFTVTVDLFYFYSLTVLFSFLVAPGCCTHYCTYQSDKIFTICSKFKI